ncbi:hypothetical protein IIA79_06545 [bacterium]|nr:hypothetical protein [bacterium]
MGAFRYLTYGLIAVSVLFFSACGGTDSAVGTQQDFEEWAASMHAGESGAGSSANGLPGIPYDTSGPDRTFSGNGATIVYTAGIIDNFALPTDPTSPSSNLLGAGSWSIKDFDDPTINRVIAHTFTSLPEGIQAATLEVHLRASTNNLSHNDGINLTFVEDDQIIPPIGSERWSRRIGTGHGVPGVLSYDWHSTTASPAIDTIILDLSNLPLAPSQPASASNLLPALNDHGFLDFWVQDDTDIDFMTLTVTFTGKVVICHIPPGNPGAAHTITVNASALNAHLNHGDTLGPCDDDHDDG